MVHCNITLSNMCLQGVLNRLSFSLHIQFRAHTSEKGICVVPSHWFNDTERPLFAVLASAHWMGHVVYPELAVY